MTNTVVRVPHFGAFEYGWPKNSSSNSDKMNLDLVSTRKTFILVENLGALFVLFH